MHRFWSLAIGIEILALLLIITYMILEFSSPIKQETEHIRQGGWEGHEIIDVQHWANSLNLVNILKLFAAILREFLNPFYF